MIRPTYSDNETNPLAENPYTKVEFYITYAVSKLFEPLAPGISQGVWETKKFKNINKWAGHADDIYPETREHPNFGPISKNGNSEGSIFQTLIGQDIVIWGFGIIYRN